MSEISHGYCECGCGQKTIVSHESNKAKGWVKGEPRRYLNHHNTKGEHHPRWKGGKRLRSDGYMLVRTGVKKTELEHRLNAKKINGGELPAGSIVHHTNGKSDNDSIMVFSGHSEHAIHHANQRAMAACGHEDWRKCSFCHQWDAPENLHYVSANRSRYHKKCAAEHVAKQRAAWKSQGKKRKS